MFLSLHQNDKSHNSSFTDYKSKNIILKLPYLGKFSIHFSKKIAALLDKFGIGVKLCSLHVMCSYFLLKSLTSIPCRLNVVYLFRCLWDANTYISMTKRQLTERVAEHLDLKKLNLSAVGTHLTKCQACHQCDNLIGNFTILKQCRNNF